MPAGALERIGTGIDILGECPTWHAEQQALYWIDIRAPAIRCLTYASGAIRSWTMPELVGSIALTRDGKILIALRTTIRLFDPATGHLSVVASLPAGENFRFNDGKCDRQGRFWVGSMDDVGRGPVGSLYRLDLSGCTAMLGEVAVPNSLCWSPDSGVMYFADGREPVIWSFAFDPERGEIADRREFVRLEDGTGIPDGATVDAEGCIWSAQYGGGVVTRYRPDGTVDRVIEVPVSQPTSCGFGGPELDILFITTASQRLSPEQRDAQPLAGALLALRPGVKGIAEAYVELPHTACLRAEV
jgi:L-arabinonolactonase